MNEMTTAELNQFLENIAKLIEATAKDTEAAAKIVRDSKWTSAKETVTITILKEQENYY